MEFSPEFWQEISEKIRFSKTTAVVSEVSEKFGLSPSTIYRNLRKYGWSSGRKREKKGPLTLTKDDILKIAKIYHGRKKKYYFDSKMSVELAVEIYKQELKEQGTEKEFPSVSTIARWLRDVGLSRKKVNAPSPKLRMRTLYSNHVHMYDTSVCRFYLKQGKVSKIERLLLRDYYKNKEYRYKDKVRLVRHVLVDHLSGAFFVKYSFTENIILSFYPMLEQI